MVVYKGSYEYLISYYLIIPGLHMFLPIYTTHKYYVLFVFFDSYVCLSISQCLSCLYLYTYLLFIHSTSLLQDKFFITKHLTDVKRVRWYPGSPEDNHIVVLTNNKNCLRLFKVDKGTGKLVSIWRLGRQTSEILASLGDTAVDFDFAPPVLLGSRIQSDPSIMWPILVLKGNGKIIQCRYYINKVAAVQIFLNHTLKPKTPLEENVT